MFKLSIDSRFDFEKKFRWKSFKIDLNGNMISRRSLLKVRLTMNHVPCAYKFWEPDKRGGYKSNIKPLPIHKHIKEGMKLLKPELQKYKEEQREKFRMDSLIPIEHGDYEIPWKFHSNKAVEEWIVTCDNDNNEGYTRAEFILSRNKSSIFKGFLDTKIPKDGVTKSAGYANITGPKKYKSFRRHVGYDWERYNNLMLRVRGDGRAYMIIAQMKRYFDVNWFDQYHYPLYTRGGPYWQTVFLPFNKFFMTGKGRIQNKQENLMEQLSVVSHIGISLADGCTGPFQLEIDYIGLYYDSSHNEETVYEMYETEPFKAHD